MQQVLVNLNLHVDAKFLLGASEILLATLIQLLQCVASAIMPVLLHNVLKLLLFGAIGSNDQGIKLDLLINAPADSLPCEHVLQICSKCKQICGPDWFKK